MAGFCLLRYLCRHDLFFLGTAILGYKGARVDESFHHWFCDELSVEEDSLFLLPRDHTKSTWGIAIKVTQDVIQDPNQSILLGSLTSSLSVKRLAVVKLHLANKKLTTLFPEFLSPNPELDAKSASSYYKDIKWQKDEITVIRDVTRAEATVETAGADQYRTGRHYERVYLDDIINEQTVCSEVKSERAMEFVKYTIPMINPVGGIMRMYGTRYDPADLYSWLIDKINAPDDDEFSIDMRVINREVVENYETFIKYQPIKKREFRGKSKLGEKAFIYSYYNAELLEKKRAWLESDFIFYCQYWNRIEGIDERCFPPPYTEIETLPDGLTYYLTVDPAFKPSKRSDYTAIVVCGYKNTGDYIYIAEAIRLKGHPEFLLNKMYELYDRYHYVVAGMEDGAWQDTLAWAFEHARKHDEREKLPIRPVKLKFEAMAKDNRIRGLSYFFKKGCVVLRKGLDDLQRELNRYPGNTRSKDDLLDALSMQRELIAWGSRPNVKPTWVRRTQTYGDLFRPKKRYRNTYTPEYVARMQENVKHG